MIKLGIVSSIEGSKVRVIIPDIDITVSYLLETAKNISSESLEIKEKVLVAFYTNDMRSGVIIAEVR